MLLTVYNGEAVGLKDIPQLSIEEFRKGMILNVRAGARVASLFGQRLGSNRIGLLAVLVNGDTSAISVFSTEVNDFYPSLTPDCPQVHYFEREIAEEFGVIPQGHPWLKPVRSGAGVTNFFQLNGEEAHEVAVGPVHAGVIEPGHFRFQCHGEQVFNLEISLGYQHRGVERALVGGPTKRTSHYMETLAGDTSIGHSTAYSQLVESLAGCTVSPRAEVLRGVSLELERLANHTGDLGALAGDVGYLPTMSYCGRIRGDFLNMTALLCGNRFGRGMVKPGGVGFDAESSRVTELLNRLERAFKDASEAIMLLWEAPSVLARFEDTGALSQNVCRELGLVGLAARACGIEQDVRREFPFGIFRFFQIPVSTWETGDVFARAYVRWIEIQRSVAFIQEQLQRLPGGAISAEVKKLKPNQFAVSLVEGWRGEICHTALTDEQGRFSRYKIVDPSFHNWIGLAMALRNQQISDFPLCNKSFNLSYCGHDL